MVCLDGGRCGKGQREMLFFLVTHPFNVSRRSIKTQQRSLPWRTSTSSVLSWAPWKWWMATNGWRNWRIPITQSNPWTLPRNSKSACRWSSWSSPAWWLTSAIRCQDNLVGTFTRNWVRSSVSKVSVAGLNVVWSSYWQHVWLPIEMYRIFQFFVLALKIDVFTQFLVSVFYVIQYAINQGVQWETGIQIAITVLMLPMFYFARTAVNLPKKKRVWRRHSTDSFFAAINREAAKVTAGWSSLSLLKLLSLSTTSLFFSKLWALTTVGMSGSALVSLPSSFFPPPFVTDTSTLKRRFYF